MTATAASLHAETAYSTPCGYIQTELYAKETGYLGLGVHPEALMQHTLQEESVAYKGSEVTITDSDVDFQDLMDEKSAYVLVLHFGDEALALPLNRDGWEKPGSCWTTHEIVVDDSLLSKLVKTGKKPDSYILRKARTLDDVLGSTNQFGLKSGSAISADTVNIFNSATTQLAIYYDGREWKRRGAAKNIGGMPVFSHEPLTITRKPGDDVTAVVIGEVSMKHQKLVMPKSNSLLHTRLPLAQTLAETALELPDDTIVNIPIGEKNAMVKVVRQGGAWKRDDNKQDVSNIPFHGAFSVYDASSKTPAHITVSNKHFTNK
ncbi:hypothetical protein [Akkermansia sp.]|uniref:hypothetical protein n=1 Tax=Akkermansia sp. TaxID=1872421 RepID=UPI0025B85BD6|nr:hypothetical protein [Akkermansia sp.]MCC8148470.1 hypothetical protein [Akkermansia sp.]